MFSIVVNSLTRTFGKFTAVDNIDFKVKKGEVFGFLGANGAGKSTTIRMLCGILEPTSGDAIVDGFSIKKEPDKVKRRIGYMSQRFSLYNDLTVEENINFYSGVYGLKGKDLEERKKWVLKTADLENRKDTLTGSLPGGIKQRLALGTAVVHKPGIVFLDEPTSGVDPVSRRNFWDLINELSSEGITVLVTTHYLEEAEFCNNIIMINAGKIIAEGNPKELKSRYLKRNIIEIETDDIIKTLRILQPLYFTEDVSVFGNYVHLHVNDLFEGTTQISEVLSENSVKLIRAENIVPTLEDVFIHLLEKEKKNA
jgi:ABC-2 type transport system ATP-binding protein